MSRTFTTVLLICAAGLAWAATVHAQAEQTPENILDEPLEPPAEEAQASQDEADDAPASSETDFNEENFRRSMELRDQALQRSPGLTTGTYSGATGLDVLDELPEASQKHLRSELREVIVRNGPWTPDQAGVVYPYTPSEAARQERSLARQEQAAWGELVGKYHEREAAIHANAARSRAATAKRMAADGRGQGKEGEEPESQTGNAGGVPRGTPGDGAENVSSQQAPVQGVSQNALELLTSRQQLPANATSNATSQATPGGASQVTPGEARLAEERSAADAQAGKEDAVRETPEMDLESEDVIAIDDLGNVRLEAEEPEEN